MHFFSLFKDLLCFYQQRICLL